MIPNFSFVLFKTAVYNKSIPNLHDRLLTLLMSNDKYYIKLISQNILQQKLNKLDK